MMRSILIVFVVLSLSLGLAACQRTGTRGGAVNAPARLASEKIILQVMGQGLLGAAFSSLNAQDQRRALEAEYRALEYAKAGQGVTWQSEGQSGGASGSVTPGQPYRVGAQNCRQYRHEFTIGGVPKTARGSACRNDDGSWSPLE